MLPKIMKFREEILIIFYVIQIAHSIEHIMYNQVETEQGAIRGQVFETNEGIRAEAYKGIPFAEPPVGDLRWRLPVEKKSWRGVRDALNYSSSCIQFYDFNYGIKYNQSEDCLYLNVFTPNSSIRNPLLPVLVFIHGGSFISGSGSDCLNMTTIARNFLNRGIVFVTINYRLGALGFLENQEDELTNFGIWDMIMALKWTKQNIQQFGGNSSQITIMGQSSGAAATSLLALIDQTKDLVSRAIIVSGSFHATWSSLRVGEYGLTSSSLVEYLRNIFKSKSLYSHSKDIYVDFYCEYSVVEKCKAFSDYKNESECQIFADCLTNNSTNRKDAFECIRKYASFHDGGFQNIFLMLDSPKVVYDKDLVKLSHEELVNKARMPIMIGVMGYEEGRRRHHSVYYLKPNGTATEERIKQLVEASLEMTINHFNLENFNTKIRYIADEIYSRYFNSSGSEEFTTKEVIDKMSRIESELLFNLACQSEIDVYTSKDLPVYAFSFDYASRGKINFQAKLDDEMRNMSFPYSEDKDINYPFHGFDLLYSLCDGNCQGTSIEPFDENDYKMAQFWSESITNFVKNANPSSENFEWPQYKRDSKRFATIDLPPKISEGNLYDSRSSFWHPLISEFISTYDLINHLYHIMDYLSRKIL